MKDNTTNKDMYESILNNIDTDWIEDNPYETLKLIEYIVKDNITMYENIQFYKATLQLAQVTFKELKKYKPKK